MFASTFETIAFKTKDIPTLTSRDHSSPYKTKVKFIDHFEAFENAHISVIRIKQQLKKIYKNRLELIPRDIQTIFNKNIFFCRDALQYKTHEQMFKDCDKDQDGKLCEEEQMYIFTHLLQNLYQKKQECIKNQNYSIFNILLNQIKKIQKELPLLQDQIRNKIKQKKIMIALQKKQEKLQEFQKLTKTEQEKILEEKQQKILKMKNNHNQQIQNLQQTFYMNNNKYLYKARPSVTLRQAKNNNLLEKLAPYKSEKKRDYQCETLRNDIISKISQQQKRINKTIEVQKNYQRIFLKKQQKQTEQLVEVKFDRKYRKLLANLSTRKQQLQQTEQGKIRDLLNKDKKQANNRIDWISKAIRVARQRKDSGNIGQIVMNHKDISQFNNTIEQISNLNFTEVYNGRNFSFFGSDQIESSHKNLGKTFYTRNKILKNDMFYTIKPGKHESDNIEQLYNPNQSKLKFERTLTTLYDNSLNLKK